MKEKSDSISCVSCFEKCTLGVALPHYTQTQICIRDIIRNTKKEFKTFPAGVNDKLGVSTLSCIVPIRNYNKNLIYHSQYMLVCLWELWFYIFRGELIVIFGKRLTLRLRKNMKKKNPSDSSKTIWCQNVTTTFVKKEKIVFFSFLVLLLLL